MIFIIIMRYLITNYYEKEKVMTLPISYLILCSFHARFIGEFSYPRFIQNPAAKLSQF
jgi:hypothetical protein